MLRVLLANLILFLLPFIGYALWLFLARKGNRSEYWTKGPIAWLTVTGLVLVISGFVAMATIHRNPEGLNFRPSEMRDGVFVPGRFE